MLESKEPNSECLAVRVALVAEHCLLAAKHGDDMRGSLSRAAHALKKLLPALVDAINERDLLRIEDQARRLDPVTIEQGIAFLTQEGFIDEREDGEADRSSGGSGSGEAEQGAEAAEEEDHPLGQAADLADEEDLERDGREGEGA